MRPIPLLLAVALAASPLALLAPAGDALIVCVLWVDGGPLDGYYACIDDAPENGCGVGASPVHPQWAYAGCPEGASATCAAVVATTAAEDTLLCVDPAPGGGCAASVRVHGADSWHPVGCA